MKRTLIGAGIALPLILAPVAQADTIYVAGTSITPERASQGIAYPASLINMGQSVQVGQQALDVAIKSATRPTTVFGISQGAIVEDAEKAALMADPNRPAANQLNFIEYGDPDGPTGILGRNPGITVPILNIKDVAQVATPYNTEVVIRQYDGIADWPKNQFNLLADANAIAGIVFLHPDYNNLNLATAKKTVSTNNLGGVTTAYLVKTKTLPLLQPLVDIGVPKPIIRALNKALKPIVDSAYKTAKHSSDAKHAGKHHKGNK